VKTKHQLSIRIAKKTEKLINAENNTGNITSVQHLQRSEFGLANFKQFQKGVQIYGPTSLSGSLLVRAGGKINFGTKFGNTGYGFRDNGGTLEFRNSDISDVWTAFGGGLTPGGNAGEIQFNDGAGGLGASSNLSFAALTSILTIDGDVKIGGHLQGTSSPLRVTNGMIITGSLFASGTSDTDGWSTISGSLQQTRDGRSYLIAGTDITISSASTGQVTISSTGGSGGTPAGSTSEIQFNQAGSFGASSLLTFQQVALGISIFSALGDTLLGNSTANSHQFTGSISQKGDGSTSKVYFLSGSGAGASPNEIDYADTAFFVSGSEGSKGTSVRGTAVFGGDVVISGTLHGASPVKVFGGLSVTGSLEMKPVIQGQPAILRNPAGPVKVFASDNLKLGSGLGIIDLLDLDDGAAGQITLIGSGPVGARAVSINSPGTLHFTGSVGGSRFSGPILANGGLSGSLQRLTDGLPYLRQGGGITITSASNGQITLRSTSSGVRYKVVSEVTNSLPLGSPFTINGADFSEANYNPNLIDILVNGQLLYSGSQKDYVLTANELDQVTFEFGLIPGDIVTSITHQ
jgi:cytoskeletal protein CcmA (bactofilin family)